MNAPSGSGIRAAKKVVVRETLKRADRDLHHGAIEGDDQPDGLDDLGESEGTGNAAGEVDPEEFVEPEPPRRGAGRRARCALQSRSGPFS